MRVASELLAAIGPPPPYRSHILYLEGEKTRTRHDTDAELPFRQESNFFYLTGCQVPGASLVVSLAPRGEDKPGTVISSTLFIPNVDPEEVMCVPSVLCLVVKVR
jgi:Xaa-Pro dipeptidase